MNLKNIEKKNRFVGIYEKAINNKFNWDEKVKIAKSAGYDFIEFSIDESDEKLSRLNWNQEKINELINILQKENFWLNSMTLSAHRRYPFGSKDKKTRKIAIEILEKAILLAKKLGIRIIQIATYDEYYYPQDDETRIFFIEGMKEAIRLAQKYSVVLAFETMDTQFAGTISKCLNFVNQLNSPYIFIYPDIGNLSQFSNDIRSELELGKNKIVAFHFKDTLQDKFKLVPFGVGNVDFVKILKIIKDLKINSPIMIEMWSSNDENETIDQNIKFISDAKKFYDNQWKIVGKDE